VRVLGGRDRFAARHPERAPHGEEVLPGRRLVRAHREGVVVDPVQVDSAGHGLTEDVVGLPRDSDRDRVEERPGHDLDAALPEPLRERTRISVGAARDRRKALRTVPDGIHAGHHREEDLRRADVGGRLLAPDVLLAGL
jgi:hypothetical protein